MREHKNLSYDHLEQPARITSIFETLESSGCTSRMIVLPAREVSEDEVALVHSRKVWDRVNAIECKVSLCITSPGSLFRDPALLRWGLYMFHHSSLALSISAVCSDDHDGDTEQV
jgi:acetoin utilization deacetylase AcuC-like enzyme